MKKSILVVLLVILAIMVWTVLVTAKATNKEKVQQPTQIQKTEAIPGPEAFPAVVLPKAKPTKPTTEDFQKLMLEKKGITPEMLEQMKSENVPDEGLETAEKEPLTFCTIGNQVLPCCYRSTPDNLYLRCWGAVSTATFMDPDNNGYGIAVCPYPIYPFNATKVMMALNTGDTCTVVFRPEIWSAAYIDHSPYPDAPIWIGPEYTVKAPGGTWQQYFSLGADVCLNDRWFAVITYMNTDDRYDPDYCPAGNTLPAYQSWIFDIAGRLEQSYWGPYAEYGYPYGFFDVVENGICSGAIRVRTQGYNRPENACPVLPDEWFWKDAFTDYPTHYAPSGLPDFYQYQQFFPNLGMAYCGPAAGANSIWWFAASSQFKPSWGGWEPQFPPILIQEVAAAAKTDPVLGTNCDTLEAAILSVIKAHGGWWFEETTVYAPDFWYLQYQLRICEDVILLLGFWQVDSTTVPPTWNRFGGHFVTLAGVDYKNFAFALSDPAEGAFENGQIGMGRVGEGIHILPHFVSGPTPIHEIAPIPDPPAFHPQGYHNDAGNVSHDGYFVAWDSPSPGGLLWLPDYYTIWPLFENQNAGPIDNTAPYNDTLPVYVEVEQAIVVSPGPFEIPCPIYGSHIHSIENNHGGIEALGVDFGAGIQYGLYYGSLVVGSSQDDLACDYGDYRPLHTFEPLAAPDSGSFVMEASAGDVTVVWQILRFRCDSLDILENVFAFWVPVGSNQEPEYVIVEWKNFHNLTDHPIVVKIGKWKDFDISAGGTGDLVDFNQLYQSIWMYDATVPNAVFGETEAPEVPGEVPITGYGLSQAVRVYDGQYMDSLYVWMNILGWGIDNPTTPEDKSIIIAQEITIPPDSQWHEKVFLEWGYGSVIATGGNDPAFRTFIYRLLHFLGYYRGDVNKDGKENVTDVIYKINYLFKGGPKPIDFVDQADVNCDGKVNVTDVIYEINYLFKGGPPPIDKNRAMLASPVVDQGHKDIAVRVPGLFGDPVWRTLHP